MPRTFGSAEKPANACCAASTRLPKAVKVTLSRPQGSQRDPWTKSYGAPRITKDGVTVAKEIELSDKFENMGAADGARGRVPKTNDIAGDGTTTAIVLAQAIVREGAKAVSAGMNPMDLKRGIDKAVIALITELKKRSKKNHYAGVQKPRRLARSPANGEVEIGKMIAEGDAEGRQRRRHHGRGSQEIQTELDVVEGIPAVRPWLHVALLHHQRREDDR